MPIKETKLDEPGTGISETLQKYTTALLVLLFVIAGAAGASAFYYKSQVNELKVNPQKAAQAETTALIERVSKLIFLPADELPTIATVADPSKLKDQPFFAKAQQGDKVLIYTNARKAILYDPRTNKIIEVAPVNIGSQAATAGAATDQEAEK